MISIRESVNLLEKLDQLNRLHEHALSETLRSVEEQVFPLFPDAATLCGDGWRQLAQSIGPGLDPEILRTVPRLVERVLSDFAGESRRIQWQEILALREMIASLGRTVEQLQTTHTGHQVRIGGFSDALQSLASVENPGAAREQLSRLARELKSFVEQMAEDTQLVASKMESEMAGFHRRLAAAEAAASTDPLTGLANRREMNFRIKEAIDSGLPFCLLLFDLDRFKTVNDRFGHHAGDAVLCRFATLLAEQVRPGDLVARWGGDEFIVLLRCSLQEAMQRSARIAASLSRPYRIPYNQRSLDLPLRASTGVAEHRPGESPRDFLERVDQAMYSAKRAAHKDTEKHPSRNSSPGDSSSPVTASAR